MEKRKRCINNKVIIGGNTMKGQKCSACGYHMEGVESLVNSALKVFGGLLQPQNAFGTNTISNAVELKCPNCGAVGRWIREDE